MDISQIRSIFTPPHCPWLFEVKDKRMNENDIYVFGDRLSHRIYLVWHCIDRPGHWQYVSNKGDFGFLPENLSKFR